MFPENPSVECDPCGTFDNNDFNYVTITELPWGENIFFSVYAKTGYTGFQQADTWSDPLYYTSTICEEPVPDSVQSVIIIPTEGQIHLSW